MYQAFPSFMAGIAFPCYALLNNFGHDHSIFMLELISKALKF
jgi:hypothetical protein